MGAELNKSVSEKLPKRVEMPFVGSNGKCQSKQLNITATSTYACVFYRTLIYDAELSSEFQDISVRQQVLGEKGPVGIAFQCELKIFHLIVRSRRPVEAEACDVPQSPLIPLDKAGSKPPVVNLKFPSMSCFILNRHLWEQYNSLDDRNTNYLSIRGWNNQWLF